MNTKKWFRWEREASIHLLFPTLEGSMEPLKKHTGFSFPTTILIFKDGVVTWCMKEEEFYQLGSNLRNTFKDPLEEKQLVKDLKTALTNLQKVESTIDLVNLEKLSNQEMLELYHRLHQAFSDFYAIGAISTPLTFEAEHFLKEKTKLPDDVLHSLTAPNKASYSKLADQFLLRTKNIKQFLESYFWIDNNYSQAQVLTEQKVVKRLKQLAEHQQEVDQKTIDYQDINFSDDVKRVIELVKNFSIYKDDRKQYILIYLHYLEIILREISRRSSLTMDQLRSIFPWEVAAVLDKKISSNLIDQRKKYCVVVLEEGQDRAQILEGEKAKEWEEKTLEKISNAKVIKGTVASKGKVTAKVRVLLHAKDCHKLKKGEVLVTFMTSPDFMPAIIKCSAIITNLGGITSHAAIISRELGKPCIIGTKNATQVIKTGDLVEVDANQGKVRLIKRA
jgi:phosphohistidine swiveling domain-containing protein